MDAKCVLPSLVLQRFGTVTPNSLNHHGCGDQTTSERSHVPYHGLKQDAYLYTLDL